VERMAADSLNGLWCDVVAPLSIEAPQVRLLQATDLELTWRPPAIYTGPLTHYLMSGYLLDHVTSSPINATVSPLNTTGNKYIRGGAVAQRVGHLGLRSVGRGFKSCSRQRCVTTLGKLFTPMCLCHQAV